MAYSRHSYLFRFGAAYGPGALRRHLWICTHDFDGEEKMPIYCVNTFDPDSDASCMLDKGDHSFLKAPSFINYSLSFVLSREAWRGISGGNYEPCEDVSQEIATRITAGAAKTDNLRVPLRNYLRKRSII